MQACSSEWTPQDVPCHNKGKSLSSQSRFCYLWNWGSQFLTGWDNSQSNPMVGDSLLPTKLGRHKQCRQFWKVLFKPQVEWIVFKVFAQPDLRLCSQSMCKDQCSKEEQSTPSVPVWRQIIGLDLLQQVSPLTSVHRSHVTNLWMLLVKL